MRYEKAETVMQLALDMQASRAGISLVDIQRRFRVGERTAQRMKDAVLRLFPQALETSDDERRKRWRIPAATVTGLVGFSAEELADLAVAARLLRRDNQRLRAATIDGVIAKIRAILKDGEARRLDPDIEALLEAEGLAMRPGPRPLIRGDVVDALRAAIKAARKVFVVHRNRQTGERRGRNLEPYGFLFGSRHYLVARSAGRSPEIRLFGLSNIERVRPLDKAFTRDPSFSIETYAQQSFGVFQEPAEDVIWRFGPAAAASARDYLFHPTQRLEEQPDGSLIVRFRAGGLREMAWHVYTWGGDLEVLAPPRLVAMCRPEAHR